MNKLFCKIASSLRIALGISSCSALLTGCSNEASWAKSSVPQYSTTNNIQIREINSTPTPPRRELTIFEALSLKEVDRTTTIPNQSIIYDSNQLNDLRKLYTKDKFEKEGDFLKRKNDLITTDRYFKLKCNEPEYDPESETITMKTESIMANLGEIKINLTSWTTRGGAQLTYNYYIKTNYKEPAQIKNPIIIKITNVPPTVAKSMISLNELCMIACVRIQDFTQKEATMSRVQISGLPEMWFADTTFNVAIGKIILAKKTPTSTIGLKEFSSN